MARRKHLWTHMYWTFVTIFQSAVLTSSTDVTTPTPNKVSTEGVVGYAWSAWGPWSPCSKSCGGGISVQDRQCLPRSRLLIPDGTLPTPVITVRVTRDVNDCAGLAKRYYECNTKPCQDTKKNSRAMQCADYNRRPFRGRFYTWVPYIDGKNPCTLNCRPLGQHFYASLSLVADGTPCTKPGSRAICVQGICKAIGHEGVLAAASSRELRCGRRLVAGLFSRPRLPLGYSYITTVPRGACRLNVTEIHPSENYIALKISNSSFIINGEFAVSSPGLYDAAGTRFIYSRNGGLDSVFAMGPTLSHIDIMVLYTKPKPSIKYQYFTESQPGEDDLPVETVTKANVPEEFSTAHTKHIRRHHSYDSFEKSGGYTPRNPDFSLSKDVISSEEGIEENIVGDRRFIWKILSYTQCSRSCGGGIQVGKYRCVETMNGFDKEVSSVHCKGTAPVGRRRRCGNVPCAPRWRTAAWTVCPECGPASRTRIVGCVQDQSRGITKVSNSKCETPKPPTTDKCNIPDCSKFNTGEVKFIEKKDTFLSENTDNFHDGPVYSVPVYNKTADEGPDYIFSAAAGWIFTEWSECVGWCVGSGIQTRQVSCTDPSGCAPRIVPESTRQCTPTVECNSHDGHWFTGEWSPCSSNCDGKQIRGVICIGDDGRHLKDVACKSPKPEHEKNCGEKCQPFWFFSDWSQCIGSCLSSTGIQRRTVWCVNKAGARKEEECLTQRPESSRSCELRCDNVEISTLPPGLNIEPRKVSNVDTTPTTTTTTLRTTTTAFTSKDCEDKLNNCVLAVQARLCHYNYYILNCCSSCYGR